FLSREALVSFVRIARRQHEFAAGLIVVLGVILVAIFAAQLTPYDPRSLSAGEPLQPPNLAHPFGTDNFGRDILSRVIYAARPDLIISITAVAISMVVGVPIGILSGYRGRRSDTIIMAVVDIMLAFPIIIFAMALVVSLGASASASIIAIGIAGIPLFSRITRGQTLSVRESQYVEAAYASGSRDR